MTDKKGALLLSWSITPKHDKKSWNITPKHNEKEIKINAISISNSNNREIKEKYKDDNFTTSVFLYDPNTNEYKIREFDTRDNMYLCTDGVIATNTYEKRLYCSWEYALNHIKKILKKVKENREKIRLATNKYENQLEVI